MLNKLTEVMKIDNDLHVIACIKTNLLHFPMWRAHSVNSTSKPDI